MHSIVWMSVIRIAGFLSVIAIIHSVGAHLLLAQSGKAQALAAGDHLLLGQQSLGLGGVVIMKRRM
jgi:hypothetical protein